MAEILLIFGGKSTAIEIREVAINSYLSKYEKILLVVQENEVLDKKYDYISENNLKDFICLNTCKYIIGFTNHDGRHKIQKEMSKMKVEPENIIHPSAIISKSASLGIGNYIAAGSVISSNAIINDHCIINYHVTVGHDSIIKSNSALFPGSRIGGNVIIGERVLIGANSFIFQGRSIGNDCIIDAMTYVGNDLEDYYICSSKSFKKFKRVK
jgi:sugar O-acyltransferase (sialic acid O-acetyltransferase NeuD family)